MKKVITYGTFDLLHYGHINLLKRAKALGDYLIVGVTTDSYDISRGKLNVQQSLMERIQAVKDTGLADEVIPEEYIGQKIDDIRRYHIDIFAIGSDWEGKFDYLKEYCEVVYLPRTANISSTKLRRENSEIRIGIIGYEPMVDKFITESRYVGNVELSGIFLPAVSNESLKENNSNINMEADNEVLTSGKSSADEKSLADYKGTLPVYKQLEKLLDDSDAVYVVTSPDERAVYSQKALEHKKHVLCESPVALKKEGALFLTALAKENGCVFLEAIKTAYFMAFNRLVLLAKSGEVGSIKAVEATCTQMMPPPPGYQKGGFGSMAVWGPFGLLAVFSILGTEYKKCGMVTYQTKDSPDLFSRIEFLYPNAVATVKTGIGVKSEGELIITGTKGYIYVPSPWWKTDYFEVRYEDFTQNRRYFYKLDGEGLRYEIAAFSRTIQKGGNTGCMDEGITASISKVMEMFYDKTNSRHDFIV